MTTFIAATLLTLAPSPLDLHAAAADLHAPPDAPGFLAPSPRSRLAYLIQMGRLEAVDPRLAYRWFPGLDPLRWESELRDARAVVADVLAAPDLAEDGPWLPTQDDAIRIASAAREDVCRLGERLPWEPDRAETIARAVCESQAIADVWDAVAASQSDDPNWRYPRRVQLLRLRQVFGGCWDRREWPTQAAWWAVPAR